MQDLKSRYDDAVARIRSACDWLQYDFIQWHYLKICEAGLRQRVYRTVLDLIKQTLPGQPVDRSRQNPQARLQRIVEQLEEGQLALFRSLTESNNDVREVKMARAKRAKWQKQYYKRDKMGYMQWLAKDLNTTARHHFPEQEHPRSFESCLAKMQYL